MPKSESLLTRLRKLKEKVSTYKPVVPEQPIAEITERATETTKTKPVVQPTKQPLPTPKLMFQQKRSDVRTRCLRSAKVVLHERTHYIDCQIRDETKAGFKLRLSNSADLPEKFELWIETREELQPVEVRWRRGFELGVQVTGDPIPRPRKMILDMSRRF